MLQRLVSLEETMISPCRRSWPSWMPRGPESEGGGAKIRPMKNCNRQRLSVRRTTTLASSQEFLGFGEVEGLREEEVWVCIAGERLK